MQRWLVEHQSEQPPPPPSGPVFPPVPELQRVRGPAATKVVIDAPKSLLSAWQNAVQEWTCTEGH